MWGIVSTFLWAGTPMLVTLITFTVYTLAGNVRRPLSPFLSLASSSGSWSWWVPLQALVGTTRCAGPMLNRLTPLMSGVHQWC